LFFQIRAKRTKDPSISARTSGFKSLQKFALAALYSNLEEDAENRDFVSLQSTNSNAEDLQMKAILTSNDRTESFSSDFHGAAGIPFARDDSQFSVNAGDSETYFRPILESSGTESSPETTARSVDSSDESSLRFFYVREEDFSSLFSLLSLCTILDV
jgi:hypothetical protein